jgi:hypothetical protein
MKRLGVACEKAIAEYGAGILFKVMTSVGGGAVGALQKRWRKHACKRQMDACGFAVAGIKRLRNAWWIVGAQMPSHRRVRCHVEKHA